MRIIISSIVIMLITSLAAICQTIINSNINTNESWNSAGNPYQIADNIELESGVTLSINSGVRVEFQGQYVLKISGELNATGTEQDSILFTVESGVTNHGGIRVEEGSNTSILTYVIVEYGFTRDTLSGTPTGAERDDDPKGWGGGVLVNNSNLTISHSTIRHCDARRGGGLFAYNSSILIQKCNIYNNNAQRHGGGVGFLADISAIIEDSKLYGNTALFGAGVLVKSNGTVQRNKIYSNISSGPGGGIDCNSDLYTQNVFANYIYSNTAVLGGGIVSISGGNANIRNNTIVNNTASNFGGGLCVWDASANVSSYNNIYYGNSATTAGQQIYQRFGTLTVDYCFVDGDSSGFDVLNGSTDMTYGVNNIDTDTYSIPSFVDYVNNDYHLLPNSPCIDAGTSTGAPSVDADSNATGQDGNNSVDTYENDMGAFEFLQEVETSFSDGVATDYTVDTFEGATSTIASVTLNGPSGTGTITVNCYTKSNPLDAPTGSKSVKRWYRISEDGGLSAGTNVDLQLYYSDEEFDLSGLGETGLSLWKYDNGTWVDMGGSVTTASNYVTLTGLSAVSDLAGDWAFADINDSPLPVMLSSFDAKLVSEGIELQWVTESEINNLGYEIWKSDNEFDQYRLLSDYHTNELLKGKGNSSSQNNYEYIDNDIMMDDTYYYKLYSVDYNGFKTEFGPIKIEVSADIFPEKYIISDNYPNPFNPTTYINIEHSHSLNIELEIYNVLGERIYSESIKRMTPGTTMLQWNANNMSTGIYYYKLLGYNNIKGNKLLKSGKMILLK